jgi:regulation of enolase protein 1 (concanavalin A-like superfamily)
MLKRQKGQGLVEFALILPVLMLIILAIIETALIFQGYLAVQHAAREAARWAVTYQPERGMKDDTNACTPSDACFNESEQAYLARRVEIIKQVAIEQAKGLRINPYATSEDEPNYYGVKVFGFSSFERASGGYVDSDHPSLPGLPILVQVIHNVELLDPLIPSLTGVQRVRVHAEAEMINEGTQPGSGNVAPPSIGGLLDPLPTNDYSPLVTDTPEGGGVTQTPPGTPTSTSTATPTPTPTPTGTPTATPTGPFITASDYVVTPTKPILIDVNQHPAGTYELRWVDENFNTVTVIDPALAVDATGFSYDNEFTIPGYNHGIYYIETRRSGSLIARSAAIEVLRPPSDLVVLGINVPQEIAPNEEITVSVTVQNLTAGFVSGYFDVDLYVDPAFEPIPSQPGDSKQWLLGIGPFETQVVTHVVTLYAGGAHELWAQVDSSNWVPDESDETNNIFGPLGVTAVAGECSDLSDRFSGSTLDSKWTSVMFGNASVHNMTIEDNSTLSIETNGTSIWGSSDQGGTFLYQSFTGDFVATLKINQGLDTAENAKLGLMVRTSAAANSALVMAVHTRDNGIQLAYRPTGGSMSSISSNVGNSSVPVWVRLMRIGDHFSAYYSYDGSSWIMGGTRANNLPDTVLIGIAGASYSSSTSTGNVDDFEVCPIDAEAESCQAHSDDFEDDSSIVWSDIDIGATAPGGSSRSGGTMTVSGNGASFWDSDNFHFTYQQVSGNFVATLKINSRPQTSSSAKAGLVIRSSTATDSARVMVMSRADGIQFGVRAYDGGSAQYIASTVGNNTLPILVRIVRSGDTFLVYYSVPGNNWTYAGSTTAVLTEEVMVGMGVSSYSSGVVADGNFDDFSLCPSDGSDFASPPPPPEAKPPGLKECVQAIELGDFEATLITPPWERNTPDTRKVSNETRSGNFSLNLRASKGIPPVYSKLSPWAYQAVSVPGEILATTTGTLRFWQYVESDPEGSTPDPDDRFLLAIRDSSGVTQTAGIPLAQGDTHTSEFQQKVISVEEHIDIENFAGQDIQLEFYAEHDGTESGTYFYIDDVRFDICTVQPIPEEIDGTASIGGIVEVLLAGTPTKMPGIKIQAFTPGGDLLRSQSIHDSTYHFYNVSPGIYIIYAEVWVGGHLYTATTEVEVSANERNYSVHLLLEWMGTRGWKIEQGDGGQWLFWPG